MENNFHIKSEGVVCIVTLPDRSFGALAAAMRQLEKIHGNRKIFFMQSIDKENEPFRILIVFDFDEQKNL